MSNLLAVHVLVSSEGEARLTYLSASRHSIVCQSRHPARSGPAATCDADAPCSAKAGLVPSSSYAMSPRKTTLFFVLVTTLAEFRMLEVTQVHQRSDVNFSSFHVVFCK